MGLLESAKILVVDDEPILRECIRFELEMEGAVVEEAASGHEAFASIQAKAYDLVISDVRMPNGDGIELLKNISSLKTQLPILLMTGFSDFALSSAYAKGCRGYLSKPCDPLDLVREAKRAVGSIEATWSTKADGKSVTSKVKVEAKSPLELQHAKGFSLARGGMFVSSQSGLPKVDSLVRIEMSWLDDSTSAVEFMGLVRWVRPRPEGEAPAGFGVEFCDLSIDAQAILQSALTGYLAQEEAYIPER